MRTDKQPSRDSGNALAVLLGRLHSAGAIRKEQAENLHARGQELEEGDFAHPVLRSVGEHTRAAIVRAAKEG